MVEPDHDDVKNLWSTNECRSSGSVDGRWPLPRTAARFPMRGIPSETFAGTCSVVTHVQFRIEGGSIVLTWYSEIVNLPRSRKVNHTTPRC